MSAESLEIVIEIIRLLVGAAASMFMFYMAYLAATEKCTAEEFEQAYRLAASDPIAMQLLANALKNDQLPSHTEFARIKLQIIGLARLRAEDGATERIILQVKAHAKETT